VEASNALPRTKLSSAPPKLIFFVNFAHSLKISYPPGQY
jgi:hypothetical protein